MAEPVISNFIDTLFGKPTTTATAKAMEGEGFVKLAEESLKPFQYLYNKGAEAAQKVVSSGKQMLQEPYEAVKSRINEGVAIATNFISLMFSLIIFLIMRYSNMDLIWCIILAICTYYISKNLIS